MKRVTKNIVWSLVAKTVKKVSRNYIAGPELKDATSVCETLLSKGYNCTIGYWDGPDDQPDSVKNQYLAIQNHLQQIQGKNYLSIKLPALKDNSELISAVIENAVKTNTDLHFDALTSEQNDDAIKYIASLNNFDETNLGCTLPGRWKSSFANAELAIEKGIPIRVVKGQFETNPENYLDSEDGFIELIRHIAGRAKSVRLATHNPILVEKSLKILNLANTPCELELLYGLPIRKAIAIARKRNISVRIYVAYGNAFLPYALTSIRKQPLNFIKLLFALVSSNYLSSFPALSENLSN